jgi:hypothetical protein
MKLIPLTRGLFAKIDNEDLDLVSEHEWHASPDNTNSPKSYYAYTNIKRGEKRGRVSMSRLIMGLKYKDGKEVDHVNHETLDNQKANLRICTKAQNRLNRKTAPHSSKFKGVSWYSKYNKWASRINKDGRTIFLGYFDKEILAAKEYNKFVKKFHGEYANPNF